MLLHRKIDLGLRRIKPVMLFVMTVFVLMPRALADDESVQNPTCFYSTSASDLPVQVIYLSGLFPANSDDDSNGYIEIEEANRVYLSSLANKLNIKIAVPLAPLRNFGDGYGTQHAWNLVSLAKIEKAAVDACGSSLSLHRVLLGFSSGAIRLARMLDEMTCAAFKKYNGIFVIGAQGVNGPQQGKCGRTVFEISPHVFPPLSPSLPAILKKILPAKPAVDPSSPKISELDNNANGDSR